MIRRGPFALLALTLLFACGRGEGELREGAETGDAAPPETVVATPETVRAAPDDVYSLVADIRAGIEPLPARADTAPAVARERAVQLYVTRQEEIERRWGPNGERKASEELATAVEEAETRFHELMELLSAATPPDSAAVAEAVTELDEGLETVVREARAAGVE